jgi:uncharacterized oxidoreductase
MSVTIDHPRLLEFATAIIAAGGSAPGEAAIVAGNLIAANLSGHDSHGVGMLPTYVADLKAGRLHPNRTPSTVMENGNFAVWDAGMGYGHVAARMAMEWCIATAKAQGVAIHGLRHSHHVARVGTYGEMAAKAGLVSLQFVDAHAFTTSFVAPWRGREGRVSTNPLCIAVPGTARHPPVILDFATSLVAYGKARVAYNSGKQLPPGALVSADGKLTSDPAALMEEPIGALMPFGEHKGSGLALICEILAGAIAGGGTVKGEFPTPQGITNSMLSIVFDPARMGAAELLGPELDGLIDWVKSAAPADPSLPVLVAGEPERLACAERSAHGIPIDDTTWNQLRALATEYGVVVPK